MEAVPGGSLGILGAGLGLIVLAAFVLDAFEIIFVLVPILLPPILMRVEDAQWVAVLTLLVLQTSFLLPPLGYALTMTRAAATRRAPLRAAMAALAPFILAQLLVTAAVVCWPSLAHLGQSPAPAAAAPSEADVRTAPGRDRASCRPDGHRTAEILKSGPGDRLRAPPWFRAESR